MKPGTNYIMVPLKFEVRRNLNPTSKLIYYHLMFRMRLSISKGTRQFYDSRRQAHYVIYQIKDLAHDIGLSRGAVIRGLKKLEQHGFIIRIRKFHRTMIFLPRFNRDSPYKPIKKVNSQNDTSQDDKFQSEAKLNSKSEPVVRMNIRTNTTNTDNTVNTIKPTVRKPSKSSRQTIQPKTKPSSSKATNSIKRIGQGRGFLRIQKQITHKKAGISLDALEVINDLVGDEWYSWIGVMNSAKYHAKHWCSRHLKHYGYYTKRDITHSAFRYESNPFYRGGINDTGEHNHRKTYDSDGLLTAGDDRVDDKPGSLANQVCKAIRKAEHTCRKTKKYKSFTKAVFAYFAKSMFNYFVACAKAYFGSFPAPKQISDVNGPKIPLFKI